MLHTNTMPRALHLFATRRMRVVLLFIMVLSPTSNQHPTISADTYELIYEVDTTTEMTGSITMYCRDGMTAENAPLEDVQFWLNQTILQGHANINEVDEMGIRFNLTRSCEGYYTCGRHVNKNQQILLTCKYIRSLVRYNIIHSLIPSISVCIEK